MSPNRNELLQRKLTSHCAELTIANFGLVPRTYFVSKEVNNVCIIHPDGLRKIEKK